MPVSLCNPPTRGVTPFGAWPAIETRNVLGFPDVIDEYPNRSLIPAMYVSTADGCVAAVGFLTANIGLFLHPTKLFLSFLAFMMYFLFQIGCRLHLSVVCYTLFYNIRGEGSGRGGVFLCVCVCRKMTISSRGCEDILNGLRGYRRFSLCMFVAVCYSDCICSYTFSTS